MRAQIAHYTLLRTKRVPLERDAASITERRRSMSCTPSEPQDDECEDGHADLSVQ